MEQFRSPEIKPDIYTAIITLGSRLIGQDKLSLPGEMRAKATGIAIATGLTLIAILSGGGCPSEAKTMQNYILNIFSGISSDQLILEQNSTSTKSNMRYSAIIAQELHYSPESMAFITNAYHLPRALVYARIAGLDGITGLTAEGILIDHDNRWREIITQFYQSPEGRILKLRELLFLGAISPAMFLQTIRDLRRQNAYTSQP
ncbi:hypothetical protein A3F03_02845 [Candidatus Roizmanbacteria bacterium RIFCSPHIGHO2_12_FULL_41_11]|uniref:DUF218 domain-containing protein n=3 Tax=Candidatus Roizmaniibacteriota TaxID=1752723 RepID=A0A1F7JQL8_9BACT|nr:MAG: hypothetical protein A3F03_02845 [Candidatus Roizmanbacteria bacterium RIFCSPHIGHO2_12_FULL_41_11]OGK51844.1 MAG: hypothetical protein A2966_00495 [Candidatus Roizmanbacteria bacterium RIFCSPLOWO2_01_FULL_41_22]OGK57892.1 MAG: hypothetical protein A3H86_01100 [Candidatus Roizmanbacteria bacterium RIFCSPLOWO2_02_FULL_41_9]